MRSKLAQISFLILCLLVAQQQQQQLLFTAAQPATDKITSLPGLPAEVFKSQHYSGYLDSLGGRKTFYYFVESENDPKKDPLILWLNGGPGCSSLLGLFTENGPFVIRHDGEFYNNPYTWATHANMLYFEAPAGVGFSKDVCAVNPNAPCTNWTDTIAAELNLASLQAFLEAAPQYKGRALYLTGESYAGHYVPQLADQIYQLKAQGSNDALVSMMKGFMVGNPCTGNFDGSDSDLCWLKNDPTLLEFQQYHAFLSFDPLQNKNRTDEWGWALARPTYDIYDIAVRYCQWVVDDSLTSRFLKGNAGAVAPEVVETGVTPEDFLAAADSTTNTRRMQVQSDSTSSATTSNTKPTARFGPCNGNWLYMYLNRADVQEALHADVGTLWTMCNNSDAWKYEGYNNPDDPKYFKGVLPIYRTLMDNTDWKMLVYSGDMDARVNFIQTQKIIDSLKRPAVTDYIVWHYMDQYNNTWQEVGGFYVQYDRISWASVRDAGHMVPTNKPAAAWQLLTSFLATGGPGQKPVLGGKEPVQTRVPPPTTAPSPASVPERFEPKFASEPLGNAGFFSLGTLLGVLLGFVGVCVWHRREIRRIAAREQQNEALQEELTASQRVEGAK